jgi:hypothetical protein
MIKSDQIRYQVRTSSEEGSDKTDETVEDGNSTGE